MTRIILTLSLAFTLMSVSAQSSPWYDGSDCLYHQAEGNSVAFGSKLFVFNGFTNPQYAAGCSHPNGQCISDTLAFFDPSTGPFDNQWRRMGRWQEFQQMLLPVTHVDVARVGDEIWLVGGFPGSHGNQATDTVQIYTPATNTWRYGLSLPVAHASGTTVQLGRKVYVTHGTSDRGGVNGQHFVYDLEHPNLGWQTLTPPPVSLNHIGVAAMRGKIYTVGGQTCHDCYPTGHQSSLMEYNPETDNWSYLTPMPQVRSHIEPGVFALDGKLYVSGGNTDQGLRRDIISYDPDNWWATWQHEYYFNTPNQWISYWAPVVKPIGDKLIFAHGGYTDYTIPENETFILPITRTRRHELVFAKSTLYISRPANTISKAEALLWTYSGETDVSFDLSNAPSWLAQVTGGIPLRPSGDDIQLTINTWGLTPGTYAYNLIAADGSNAAPTYSSTTLTIVLTVTPFIPSLAIELVSFDAEYVDGHAQLDWLTLSEQNSLLFSIERAGSNGIFEKIGEVVAAENSDLPLDYQWIDPLQSSGTFFYRLRLVDIDGTFSFSNIEEVQLEDLSRPQLFPNPSNGSSVHLRLGITSDLPQVVYVKVFDKLGKELDSQVLNPNGQIDKGILINFKKALLPGMYFVKITYIDSRQSIFETLPLVIH